MGAWTQEGKPLRLTTQLGPDKLMLETLSGYEAVSEPFELTLDLISEDPQLDPDKLLRKPVTITVDLQQGGERHFHGFVRRITQGGRDSMFVNYRAEVVPALWFLSLATDCRIFQNMTVPAIVQKILSDNGITDVKLSLTGSYDPREYCVQYRETHLAFISRLMEEEGISYFFEHEDTKHTIVLADGTSAVKAGPVAKLRVSQASFGAEEIDDNIDSFELETIVRPGKTTLADYNDEQAKRLETSAASPKAAPSSKNLELYDYPGKFAAVSGGDRYAKLRMEAEESIQKVVVATSPCRGIASGHKLNVSEHYRDDLNGAYHVLTATHNAHTNGYRSAEDDSFNFETRFTAIPFDTPFRPVVRTPKSLVYGTQTAVVVGPSGEEIFVDKSGRVKVQFFWDRLGKNDDKSSCWVRVSSGWAGKNWGMMFVPRIGQEVIVDFLEGDPDRPIITGRVYNGDQVTPWALPANGTQSGILTRSSKGGAAANANEFRFEDKKGSEQVFLHAEKNLDTEVENDETRLVSHDRTTTIQNDETKTVKEGNELTTIEKGNREIKVSKGSHTITVSEGDETYTIAKGKQTVEIDQNRTVTIKTGNDSLTVKMGNMSTEVKMGNVTKKVGLGKDTTEAMQGIELKVGQSSIKIDQTGVTIAGMMIKIDGQIQTQIKGMMTQINADAMLQLKGGITMIN